MIANLRLTAVLAALALAVLSAPEPDLWPVDWQTAARLLSGDGSTSGAGYPRAVAAVAYLSGLPVPWAARLLQVVLLSLSLTYLRYQYGARAWLVALAFGAAPVLSLLAEATAAAALLPGLLWLGGALLAVVGGEGWRVALGQVALALVVLFAVSPVGLFALAVVEVVGAYLYLRGAPGRALALFGATVGVLVGVGLYLYLTLPPDALLTAPAANAARPGFLFLFTDLSLALVASLRALPAAPGPWVWVAGLFQVALVGFVYVRFVRGEVPLRWAPGDGLAILYLLLGAAFVLVQLFVRRAVPTDPFSARTLAPFTFLFFAAGLALVANPNRDPLYRYATPYLLLLFSAAWVQALAERAFSWLG